MALIRPSELTPAGSVANSAAVMVDTGSAVEKATPSQLVDAGAPLATQEQAETGADNATRMSPLRAKQAIDALGVSAANLASTDTTKGAALVGFDPDIAGAAAQNVYTRLNSLPIDVKLFGAKGDTVRDETGAITSGTDDTAAFQAAQDVAEALGTAFTSIFVPPGLYRITATVNLNKNYQRWFGAGVKSCLCFDPSADDVMLLVQNSDTEDVIGQIEIDHLGIVANYPNAYAKTAIKIVDGTGISIHDIQFPDLSWQGGSGRGSIGFHFCGRDTHKVYDNVIKADQPMQAGVNPNNSEFQFDCHYFSANYIEIIKSTNYALFFEPGVNVSNWYWGANNNAYVGTGMIYLNNEGETVHTSSMVYIGTVRCESGTNSGGSAGGYGIYMDFGTGNQCGNMVIENFAVNDPVCNGIHLNGVTSLVMRNVNLAASGTAVTITNCNQCEIFSLGVNDSASVEFTGMQARKLERLAGATTSSKSIAYARYVRNTANTMAGNLTYRNGVRVGLWNGVLANGEYVVLPMPGAGKIMKAAFTTSAGMGFYTMTSSTSSKLAASEAGYGSTFTLTLVSGEWRFTNVAGGNSFDNLIETLGG